MYCIILGKDFWGLLRR